MSNVETIEIGLGLDMGKGEFSNCEWGSAPKTPQPSVSNKYGSGDRREFITVSQSGFSWSGSLGGAGLVDGTNNTNVYFPSQNNTGMSFSFKFSEKNYINAIEMLQSGATNQGTWSIKTRESDGSLKEVTTFLYNSATQLETFEMVFTDEVVFQGIGGATSNGPWQYEVKFHSATIEEVENQPEEPPSLVLTKDESGQNHKQGYWISELVELKDKFKEFDKVVLDKVLEGNSQTKVFTRTSENSTVFTEWEPLVGNEIAQEPSKYVQVKIELESGYTTSTKETSFVNKELEGLVKDSKHFVSDSDGVKLAKSVPYYMKKSQITLEEGLVSEVEINIDDFESVSKFNFTVQ